MPIFTRNFIAIAGLFFMFLAGLTAQNKNYLQVNLDAGLSLPVQTFAEDELFTGNGYHASAGADFFFLKWLGYGVEAGYFYNGDISPFAENVYLVHRPPLRLYDNSSSWSTGYIMSGPTFKFTLGKVNIDLSPKIGGYNNFEAPNYSAEKEIGSDLFPIQSFRVAQKDWQLAWSGRVRLIYNFNSWLGIQANATYINSMYLSNLSYKSAIRNVVDLDGNGVLDDSDYLLSAEPTTHTRKFDLTTLNTNLGLVFYIGKNKKAKKVKPNPALTDMNSETLESDDKSDLVGDDMDNGNDKPEDPIIIENGVAFDVVNDPDMDNNKNLDEGELLDSEWDTDFEKVEDQIVLNEKMYEEAESLFENEDYFKAAEIFETLVGNPDYPKAQYMLALSLCNTRDCDRAKEEFMTFMAGYSGDDERSMNILFASQFEKCRSLTGDKKDGIVNNNIITDRDADSDKSAIEVSSVTSAGEWDGNAIKGAEYRIQFVALHKKNASFNSLKKYGDVKVDYYSDMKMYRYSIAGYTDLEAAIDDLNMIRNEGYPDAFIVVYINDERKGTSYHNN